MDKEDFPSDSDDSDADFRPDDIDNESDIRSEEESDNSGSDNNIKDNIEKFKKVSAKRHKKNQKTTRTVNPKTQQEPTAVIEKPDEDAEKKRADALWADFLSDANNAHPARPPKLNGIVHQKSAATSSSTVSQSPKLNLVQTAKPEKVKITEIFEFAGEEVRVTKEVDASADTKALQATSSRHRKFPSPKQSGVIKRSAVGGSLNSILGQINKKNKITVLEKTKLDWDDFKTTEGLSEELQTFNKGKDGYLERQDFLQRTDVRQFELEKNLRQMPKRSNR